MQNLRWVLLKSKIKARVVPSMRRREAQYADLADDAVQQGLAIGRHLVAQQRAALDAARDTLRFTYQDVTIFSIEVQFLWGVYYELVIEGPTFPTNGYDRILLHIITYLVTEKRMPLKQAREIALGVQNLFNEANALFDVIQQGGRRAYREGGDQFFIFIVRALNQADDGQVKYLPIPRAT